MPGKMIDYPVTVLHIPRNCAHHWGRQYESEFYKTCRLKEEDPGFHGIKAFQNDNGTEYWKSQDRKFCDFCQCWLADNKPSILSHENGKRHKENVAKKISTLSKKSAQQHKESLAIDKDMKKMEEAAMKAYMKDIKSNPDYTSQQIIQTLEEKGELHKLDSVTQEALTPAKKSKKSTTIAPSVKQSVWFEATSDGKTYFWNTETKESIWEKPKEGFVSLEQQKNQSKEKKEELRALKAREAMKKFRVEREEKKEIEPVVLVGPAPRVDPYGGWTAVKHTKPKKIDLQLPKIESAAFPVVVPAIRESRVGTKERQFEAIDADDVPGHFKKRKLGFKGNIRRRTGDESD